MQVIPQNKQRSDNSFRAAVAGRLKPRHHVQVITQNKQCSDNSFCTGLSEDKRVLVESVIAGQIVRAVFGVALGPSGLSVQDSALAPVRHSL